MIRPVGLQLSRRKGFDLQAWSREVNGLPANSVARPGPLGNPFTIIGCREAGFRGADEAMAQRCVESFETFASSPHWREVWDGPKAERARTTLISVVPSLRGHNLACWCALDSPCHRNVLLKLANSPEVAT